MIPKAAQSALSKAAKELDEALTAEQKNCLVPIKTGSSIVSICHTLTHMRWASCTAKLINEILKPETE